MPLYCYQADDGEVVEKLFKAKERPDCIELPDGRLARFFIGRVARLNRGWSSFGIYGVNGKYNKTLKAYITSDKQHDDLCKQKGLNRITDTRDFDRIASERAKLDEHDEKIEKDIKRYNQALAETKDPIIAHERAYGESERLVAKQANDSIFSKYPSAKHIPDDIL